jgi:response regulator of citrate/malate metabolism
MPDSEDRFYGIPHLTIRGKIIVLVRDLDGHWQRPGQLYKRKVKAASEDEDIDKPTDPLDITRICEALTEPMGAQGIAAKAGMSYKNVHRLLPRLVRQSTIRQVITQNERGRSLTRYELT